MRKKPNQPVKSLDRALNILEIVASAEGPLGVTEISQKADLHKSTVYRILDTLHYRGYISQKQENEKYSTGLKLFELGSLAINELDLQSTAKPYLKELKNLTEEAVHLGVLDDGEIIYIEKVESPKTITMRSKVGKRVYAHSTSLGKAILAFSSNDLVDSIIESKGLPQKTSNTITNEKDFKMELKAIRKQGYAIDDEENEEYIRCLAGPIFNHKGEVSAAFSISGPAIRLTLDKVEEFSSLIKQYSKKISNSLGYNGEI